MRTKNIVLMLSGIFALVFALSFVIADAEFVDATTSSVITATTLNYGNVNQGQSATVSFKICDGNGAGTCNDADTDALDLLDFYDDITLTSNIVTFTDGTNTFTAPLIGAVSTLTDNGLSTVMSLTISVPSNKKGIFDGTLELDGDEPLGTPFPGILPDLAFEVNVKDVTAPVITITGGTSVVYVLLGATYTDAGATALDATDGTVVASTTSNNVNTLVEGVYSVVYTAVDLSSNSATATRTVIVYTGFCASGSSSTNLDLSKFDISNSGRGDDNKWYPLDTVEIDVEFDNNRASTNGLYDLSDVTFKLGIFDSTGKNVAGDMIWLSKDEEEFEFGDVDEGDDAKHTFKFRVNPAEFDISKDYKVKVKAFPAGKEATDCVDFSTDMSSFGTSKYSADVSIKMAKDENAVIVDKETLPLPASAQCGQKVTFTADVWNTGDQDWEDQILVTLLNTELGVSSNQTLVGDLDQGAMKQVTFSFNVPEDMEEKQYDLEMKTYYSWDADNSEYDEVSEETFKFPLSVAGNCVAPTLTVSASLESGGKAGETLVVKATITNTGTESESYTFVVSESSEWASSAKINNTLTLAAGQSGNIWVTFEVDKKTSGDQTFNIEAYSADGKLLKTQPVQVGIEGRPGLLSDSDSLVAILIALISAIVIAIIIVLIVKAAKRKS